MVADDHTTSYLTVEGLLCPIGMESTPFRSSASKVTGLLVHATAPAKIKKIQNSCYFIFKIKNGLVYRIHSLA